MNHYIYHNELFNFFSSVLFLQKVSSKKDQPKRIPTYYGIGMEL